jgi:hypothetical protein
MASLFTPPYFDVGAGLQPADGALLNFHVVGSDTRKNTFPTAAATPGTEHANPVVADALGVFPAIYIQGDNDWVLTDKNAVQKNTGSVSEFATVANSVFIKNFATLAAAIADINLVDGDVFTTRDRGGATWDVVLSSGVTENTYYIVQCTGVGTLSSALRLEGKVSLKKFGGLTDGTDNAAVINASLTAIGYAWLENDTNDTVTYVCDSMLTLGNEQIIYIDRDTLLREISGGTDPLVWCKGERSGINGVSFSSSRVFKNNAPLVATVIVGVMDYAVQTNSSDRCQLSRVRISGAAIQGATTGTPYAALAVWNPQIGGLTSYFHQINDIMLENCNYGMHLRGNANASQMSNIHLYRTGDRTVLAGAGIYIDGALENQITNVFHHESGNSDSLYMVNNCRFNAINNFVCEQGGASARGLVTDDTGANNFIQLHDNVSGGNNVGATFKTVNTVMLPKSLTLEQIETVNITSTNATATTTTTDLLAFTGASAVLAKNDITGNITFTVSGLRGVAGSLYYRASFLLIATGTETDNTNSFSIVTSGAVQGFATYNTLTATDIVGAASLAIANDTTSGFDLVITVPNAACISNATLLMVGNGSAATIIA